MTVFLSALAGCVPYFGAGGAEVNRDRLEFRDASTGSVIPAVLIVPVYGSGVGVATIDPTILKVRGRVYLDNPFIHEVGTPFVLRQPKMAAFGGPLVVVAGRAISELLIAAPGYLCDAIGPDALNATEPWEDLEDNIRNPVLERLPLKQAQEETRRLIDFFSTGRVPPGGICPGRAGYVQTNDVENRVDLRFDDRELALVQGFLDAAITQLEHTDERKWNAGIPTPTVPIPNPTLGPLPPQKLRS
jgi:hypothetical protein